MQKPSDDKLLEPVRHLQSEIIPRLFSSWEKLAPVQFIEKWIILTSELHNVTESVRTSLQSTLTHDDKSNTEVLHYLQQAYKIALINSSILQAISPFLQRFDETDAEGFAGSIASLYTFLRLLFSAAPSTNNTLCVGEMTYLTILLFIRKAKHHIISGSALLSERKDQSMSQLNDTLRPLQANDSEVLTSFTIVISL